MTQITPEWLSRNPLGTILNLANHLQSVVEATSTREQVYRIDHYLGKDTVNNILIQGLVMFSLNHFGIGST